MKNLIVLPDGSEISSGPGNITAIKSCQYTEMVNESEDLRLGSVCSNFVEVSVMAPNGLSVSAGDEITLYRDSGTGRKKKGVYTIERPTQTSNATVKLTGFDHVAKLDKDLTQWLANLNGWPYTLLEFAGMVCEACGLTLATQEIPNGGHMVEKFSQTGITGRKLMRWIGECCCRFTRANADGDIELAWYTPSGVTLTPTGEKYYFRGSFSSEKYTVAPIDAVQIMFAHTDGYKWPEAEEGANSYVITGNPFLSSTADENRATLQVIQQELNGVTYTPCKVSIPDAYGVEAGQTVQIAARNGQTVTAYVMKKTTRGLRADLQCTGNTRRDSSGAVNDQTAQQIAQDAVNAQTPEGILNKLTDNGKIQGVYVKDNKLYINGEFVQVVNLIASSIVAGILKSKNGKTYFDLDNTEICTESEFWGSIIKLKDGLLSLVDKNGIERILMGQLEFGNALLFADDDGETTGGFTSRDGWLYGTFKTDSGAVSPDKKLAWKTISYTDGTGAAQTVTVLAGI